VNIDQQITQREDAIVKLQAKADEMRAEYDSVLANIPCEQQDIAAQKMAGISALISKAQNAISRLKEEINILTCIKNNEDFRQRKICISGEGGQAPSGKGGKSGDAGAAGENASARTKTKGRLSVLERCMGASGRRGNRGSGN
jgi:hypothetical protein